MGDATGAVTGGKLNHWQATHLDHHSSSTRESTGHIQVETSYGELVDHHSFCLPIIIPPTGPSAFRLPPPTPCADRPLCENFGFQQSMLTGYRLARGLGDQIVPS
jgi:hypothetical protein